MNSNNPSAFTEHFVTLFDNNFLPLGLCLHSSLIEHCTAFHLWIVCMDELVEQNLANLKLPNISLIPLREVENEELLKIKPTRSRVEYCWTLTSFTAEFVFDRDDKIQRVTYLDADLFFFSSPQVLLNEFSESGKHVLITEHAYPPHIEKSSRALRAGRFCVQFLSFRRTNEGLRVMRWWQARCLEWCYARVEDGKFGDQKYLDLWPTLFSEEVHILKQKEKTLAPWNVEYYANQTNQQLEPVFYHFHGFRHVIPGRILLYSGYRIGKKALVLYRSYLNQFELCALQLNERGIRVPTLPLATGLKANCLRLKRKIWDGEEYITSIKLSEIK